MFETCTSPLWIVKRSRIYFIVLYLLLTPNLGSEVLSRIQFIHLQCPFDGFTEKNSRSFRLLSLFFTVQDDKTWRRKKLLAKEKSGENQRKRICQELSYTLRKFCFPVSTAPLVIWFNLFFSPFLTWTKMPFASLASIKVSGTSNVRQRTLFWSKTFQIFLRF